MSIAKWDRGRISEIRGWPSKQQVQQSNSVNHDAVFNKSFKGCLLIYSAGLRAKARLKTEALKLQGKWYILWYILLMIGAFIVQTAKIFTNGRSQAVRLPKDFRFSGKDVYVKKIGKMVILFPKDDPWCAFINSLDMFSDDFMDNRDQSHQDFRESF